MLFQYHELKLIEVRDFIKDIDLFREFTDEELSLLSEHLYEKRFKPEALLFRAGDPRKVLYVIVEGEIELFRSNSLGEESTISLFHVGDFLGETSLLDDSTGVTSARALKQTVALCLQAEKFRELVETRGSMAVKVYSEVGRVISRRLRGSGSRVVTAGAQ